MQKTKAHSAVKSWPIWLLAILMLAGLWQCTSAPETGPLNLKRYDQIVLNFTGITDSLQLAKTFQKEMGEDKYTYADILVSQQPGYGEVDSASYEALNTNGRLDHDLARDLAFLAQDSAYRLLLDTVHQYFPADYPFTEQLAPLMARFQAAFPTVTSPKLRTAVFGRDQQAVWRLALARDRMAYDTDGEWLSVGLDYFCRPDFPYLPAGIPNYIRRRFTPEHLPVMVAQALAMRLHPPLTAEDDPALVDYLVNAGIRMTLLEQLLPEAADSLRLRYTTDQTAWCLAHEAAIYRAYVPLLFEQNQGKLRPYISEGPHTREVDPQAPGRLHEFVGWRLVRQYCEQNDVSLQEVVALQDYRKVFEAANYKP